MKLSAYIFISLILTTGCGRDCRKYLNEVSKQFDPAKLELNQGFNTYVRRTHTEKGVELGYIVFADGDRAKFWFWSHHLSGDMGCTLFEFSDEKRIYMDGWFCCEVQLPETQLKSKAELKAFIHEHNGMSP